MDDINIDVIEKQICSDDKQTSDLDSTEKLDTQQSDDSTDNLGTE